MTELLNYAEIPFVRSSTNKKESGKPSQQYFDINFQVGGSGEKAFELECIVFRNYYVGSISVYQQNSAMSYTAVLESYKLMSNPYTEGDSQNWHTLHVKEFNSNYIKGRPLRIVMFQPAAMWNKIDIKQLKFLSKPPYSTKRKTSASVNGAAADHNSQAILTDYLIELLFSDLCILKDVAASQVNISMQESASAICADGDAINSDVKKSSTKKSTKKKS